MTAWTIGLSDIEASQLPSVGGKGLNLGALSKIGGLRVPDGFCVTTAAFRQALENNESYRNLLDRLAKLRADDRDDIAEIARQIRQTIEESAIPTDAAAEIRERLTMLGANRAYAVRSSATAEDLPHASFAGQQDTYLNIAGADHVLTHIRRCWASLFTDCAVTYRIRGGFDHRQAHLSVIVQHMVFPQASGILFTADPVTSDRSVVSIDAGFGLGEGLASGIVSADSYKVRAGRIIEARVASQKSAIEAKASGGVETRTLGEDQAGAQVLDEAQILELAALGRRIEVYFGKPQDIEWCLDGAGFHIVQSRAITTLFPVPEAGDSENRVYLSTGHQQMMTDAMKPLGLSFFLMVTPAPMRPAGGRLFVDVTAMLSSPSTREGLLAAMGQSDPLMQGALETVLNREDFIPLLPENAAFGGTPENGRRKAVVPPGGDHARSVDDPAIVDELIRENRESVERLKRDILGRSGTELLDFIQADLAELKKLLFDPRSSAVIMAGMGAAAWIDEKMNGWLGEKNAADALSQSLRGNVTSEMGLALLDVADAVRPYPAIAEYLRQTENERFLDELENFAGGREARAAILDYLDRYGMRCAGEIDITKTRWSERPLTLVPLILSNVRNFPPGESRRKFRAGLEEAERQERRLLERLGALPGGGDKAAEAKPMIDRIRHFAGYREYPKFGMISRYFVYKQGLLEEAERLTQEGAIADPTHIFDLTFDELREVVRTRTADLDLIKKRQEEFRLFEKLTPPRVLTSDGEALNGAYRRGNLPPGAVAGLAVSSGIIEGRARVVLRMEDAEIEEGDILVTAFTDPSWTPLFVSIAGLVTEVGGRMTHGSVIAREYGLPAVVGVNGAVKLIRDGQRIRVNGTDGYIEIL